MEEIENELLDCVRQTAGRVKLFPLPEVTLFPTQGIPLHVFEPRYRALVSDALAGDRVVGLPQILPAEPSVAVAPPLQPVLGVGIIAQHQALPDGRYNLIVRGIARCRILEEIASTKPYREARVQLLEPSTEGLTSEAAASLATCLIEVGRRLSAETAAALGQLAAMQREPGRMADLAAAALLRPQANQRVLEELQLARRLRLVTDEIAELLLATKPAAGQLPN